MSLQPRLLLLHKHRTSGRVRYLRLPDGMLAFAPLPALAMLRDPGYAPKLLFSSGHGDARSRGLAGPARQQHRAGRRVSLLGGYARRRCCRCCWGRLPRLTRRLTPPSAAPGGLSSLLRARQCREVELEILRPAYEHVLG